MQRTDQPQRKSIRIRENAKSEEKRLRWEYQWTVEAMDPHAGISTTSVPQAAQKE